MPTSNCILVARILPTLAAPALSCVQCSRQACGRDQSLSYALVLSAFIVTHLHIPGSVDKLGQIQRLVGAFSAVRIQTFLLCVSKFYFALYRAPIALQQFGNFCDTQPFFKVSLEFVTLLFFYLLPFTRFYALFWSFLPLI